MEVEEKEPLTMIGGMSICSASETVCIVKKLRIELRYDDPASHHIKKVIIPKSLLFGILPSKAQISNSEKTFALLHSLQH